MRDRRRLFNLVKGEPYIRAELPATSAGQLYLYDEISCWGVTAADFVSELAMFNGEALDLHVNSPGGDVFEGLAMLNSLRAYPGKVTAYVDGLAASAASFILMGADEVVMARNSELMIHDAWGLCMGNSSDMVDMAGRLDKVSDNIADVYASKAGRSVAEWRADMRAEVWYSADDAVVAGLADRVGTPTSSAVAYDLTRLRNSAPPKLPSQITEAADEFEWFTTDELRGAFEEAK
jgi:ATP-dependent Clp endopeptidase proteolytic subunit ClpP